MQKLIILLADVSGSMGSSASNTDEGKIFSRLDFVKQSSLFALNIIDDETLFSIVTFSDYGNVVIPPTKKGVNTSSIEAIIRDMRTQGGTSIKSGFVACKNLCNLYPDHDITIILLSDGDDCNLNASNCNSAMDSVFGTESRIKIDAIGFGPDANTKLLVKISQHNSGTYALCYDASMVGTIIGRGIARTYLGQDAYGIQDMNDQHYMIYNEIRIRLVQVLLTEYTILEHNKRALNEIATFAKNYIECNENQSSNCFEYIINTYVDMTGELYMACNTLEYWNKWGKAYWTTMGIALDKQYAPNFKDISLQHFGTDRARELYERYSLLYDNMSMVTPSLNEHYGNNRPISIISASTFNNRDIGCFHMKSELEYKGNIIKAIDIVMMLQNNEQVFLKGYHNSKDVTVEVERIIISSYKTMDFYKVNDCMLTKNHPILHNGKWEHPKTITSDIIVEEDPGTVFNLILKKVDGERQHAVYVNNEVCVCLGHGINDYSAAPDPFWGTEKVVDKYREYYQDAPIIVCNPILIRSPETGFTIDMIFDR